MENHSNLIRRNDKVWIKTYEKLGIQYDIEMPAANTSLIDIFEQNFTKHAGKTAFVCMDAKLSYEDLDRYSKQIAAYLQSLGLKKGDKVGVMMPNILQLPVAVLGVLRAGMTLVNVNPLYTSKELEHQLTDSDTKALFILENFAKTYEDIGKDLVDHVIVTSMGDLMSPLKGFIVNMVVRHVKKLVPDYNLKTSTSFKTALNRFSAKNYKRPDNICLDDIAVLQYTGGTTGVAKGAMLTHGNLVANLIQCDTYLGDAFDKFEGMDEQPVIMTALPLYHIFSFTVCGMFGLYRGCIGLLVPNPRDGASLIKAYKDYPPAFFPAVNTLFNALANSDPFKALDHSKLEMSMGGGMAVLKDTADKWQKITGNVIVQGYGLSETSPVASANPEGTGEFSGNIGLPMPATDMAILDEEGNEVALGERGEICVRGPQVMKGYWKRDDATAEVMTSDGYFRTGDIGVMDEEGYFKIVDRKKNMILVSGFNVYPNEVEDVMSGHPKILECGVIGIEDEKSGEVPKIYVVRSDDSLTKEEVLAYSKENLTGYKRPRYVEFIDELPKSNVGKILHKDLRVLEEKNHG
ncbi:MULTISPECIES: AMP-binding protein [unclassified Psychrobacter]|uniref:AMP-binding protein n=1 Tax=unclassified Psychrobacter TaxID=196806 RepID=UPI000ED34BE4|nr:MULTISPECIES: AMP-binding protein [unclassified Psychrobacter]MBE8609443.1 AMP-binding protein [Pseudomonas lundensis]HCI75440.1 long-chain fatty acid--CoA ligase [Psychrobacter sp.]